MARKNIFELLENKFSLKEEVGRLEKLAKMDNVICDDIYNYDLEEFVDKYCLAGWKNRNRCISYDDMRVKLEITSFWMQQGSSAIRALMYIEFMANMVYICEKYIERYEQYDNYKVTSAFLCIKDNLISIAENMNMEFKVFDDKEQILLIEKDSATMAVAEIVESDIAYDLIQYNHFLLKGDIEAKRKILKSLANKFEEVRPLLKMANYSTLESNTGYLLNKLNIRHNNLTGKNMVPYVRDMGKKELEEWYDEIYQMVLLCVLVADNITRNKKVEELKLLIEEKK